MLPPTPSRPSSGYRGEEPSSRPLPREGAVEIAIVSSTLHNGRRDLKLSQQPGSLIFKNNREDTCLTIPLYLPFAGIMGVGGRGFLATAGT